MTWKTKCHYNGPEFVPCEKLKTQLQGLSKEARDYSLYSIDRKGIDCGFCGASLKKLDNILKDNVYKAGSNNGS